MQPVDAPVSPVGLARRWVVDYFNSHDALAACEFATPDYTLHIGEYTFAGRDEHWLPAVQKQMDTFPGLGMTVHQIVAGTDRVAVLFTQHGASGGSGGRMSRRAAPQAHSPEARSAEGIRVACWSGVAIYRSNGRQLTGCVAQEDYLTRQRQLKSGVADIVEAPAPAPWDTVALPADPQAEAVVRQWLTTSWPSPVSGVRCDDEHITGVPLAFAVETGAITELFSSGSEVVFHIRQTGRYLGGLPGVAPRAQTSVLHCNGIVRVQDGRVRSGRVIRDRIGLVASLKAA